MYKPLPTTPPVWYVAVVILGRLLKLISSCVVVERTVTGCGGKLKVPVVKQKSFEFERKGEKYFQANQERGEMDYPSFFPLPCRPLLSSL